MTRKELEQASLATVERTFRVCEEALNTARLSQTDIDRVLLVGGATRMPMVSRKVEHFFGKVPIARINPDEVVALGAAVQASLLAGAVPERTAGPPRSPSVVRHLSAGAAVLPAGAVRPPSPLGPMRRKVTTSPGLGESVSVPTAAGARPVLVDVTPLSLGVETVGNVCDVVIAANTPVPCDRTRTFTTAADKQTTVRVRVAQGPSKLFSENTCLGELELSGIEAALRGDRTIAVTFEIDADGILNVRARDKKSGREAVAHMKLVGAQTDPKQIAAMRDRQAAHPLAQP
jgi:molecular chaperone DnaK